MSTVELHVTESGAGLPVVLLHAFPLSHAMWDHQRAALAGTCRVVTPDLRGFGASPLGSDEPSLDHCADDVVALLDRLELERVVLGGLSMGGYVAMALLRRHPDRVRALVLADTKAGADAEPAREKRLDMADRLDTEGSTDVLLEQVLPTLLGKGTQSGRPDVVERVTAMVAAAGPAAAAWAQRAMAARPDSSAILRGAGVPALVLRGDQDVLATLADARAMVDALPVARLEVLAGSGHLSALEVPEAVTAALRRFVEQLDGSD